ncbi:MAG: YjbF family lipoprotein [Acetobacteraceae bacterium]|nr:YjbF family lipoprotein [Acetobacteraceae bacterium]
MIAALLLLPLAGCGGTGAGDVTRWMTGGLLGRGEPEPMDIAARERAASEEEDAPDTLTLAMGRREATATLIQRQGSHRLWRAPGGVVVATDGARITATAGLPQMVMATRFDGPDPLEDPRALLRRGAEARRLVDVAGRDRNPAGMRFGLAFDCRLRAYATEEAGTILVEERCRVPGLSPVTNRFWASEATGRIEYAEQWVGPGVPAMALEFPSD